MFQRLEGANSTLSLPDMQERLADGVDHVDDAVVAAYGHLLPRGTYLPMLLEVRPRLVAPLQPDDYFAKEHFSTWGPDDFWGLPSYPATAYYRTFSTVVDERTHLYEFVVPMTPPAWNDPDRVAEYATRLDSSTAPTAVAVTTLDVCAPATTRGPDWHIHWALTHFLLDGHHKMAAAASLGRSLRLLCLVSAENGLSSPKQLKLLQTLRAKPAEDRQPID